MRVYATAKTAILLALLVSGASMLFCLHKKPGKGPIKVGSKSFTEQLILGEITRLVLEDAGFGVVDRLGLAGTMTTRQALEKGEIDLYWEYTGTAWLVSLGHQKIDSDAEKLYQQVKAEDANHGLVWLPYARFNSSYAVMMSRAVSQRLGITSLGELGNHVRTERSPLTFATSHEFNARPDGLPALEKNYGFQFDRSRVKVMDPGLTYRALRDGQVDVAMGFSTDGRIEAFGLVVLADDQGFFPVYNPAPVIRKEVLERHGEVGPILSQVASKLDTDAIRALNFAVDGQGLRPESVALNWLKQQSLVKP
jgi:osmoprotectant transport system substrate-binding protein